jgi:hypothetical protein
MIDTKQLEFHMKTTLIEQQNPYMKFHRLTYLKILLFILALPISIIAQNAEKELGHTYPKLGILQWGGAPAEWYARFDMAMTRETDPSFIAEVKALNPNILWLPMRDFNKAGETYNNYKNLPSSWYLYDSRGNRINLYNDMDYWANLSDVCPLYNGERLLDNFPKVLADLVRNSGSDGISSDGLYYDLHFRYNMFKDVDMDRNGVNDLDEHGASWVRSHWCNGVDQFLRNLRNALGDEYIIGPMNSGSSDTYGSSIQYVNGFLGEHISGELDWSTSQSHYSNAYRNGHQPPIYLTNVNPAGDDNAKVEPQERYYSFMRFGLGRAMLLGQYYAFQGPDTEHYYNRYYDEFDLDLGYPTTDMQLVISLGPSGQGVWVRFFDKGAVIVNMSGGDVTVTNQQLSSMNGYKGPYFRFQGGQDVATNNGQIFNENHPIKLSGHTYRIDEMNFIAGDAILLVTEPTTVVSDIIVDNCDASTSPGSEEANMTGGWSRSSCSDGKGNYTLSCATYAGSYSFSQTYAGNGQEVATFRPTIGVTGKYEIFEWHGYIGSSPGSIQEATNVPCKIVSSGVTRNLTINQSQNYGRWNSLGTYQLTKGSENYVQINNNTNGPVIADAFKFVYKKENPDFVSPNSPTNLKSDSQTETSIRLSWQAPSPASDGDVAFFYMVYRNDVLISTPSETSFGDSALVENTTYSYRIYAVDDAGNKSETFASGSFNTLRDITPPRILSVNPLGSTKIEVVFSERIEQTSAENINNYSIDNNITIQSVLLMEDHYSVQITTSEHTAGENYSLTVNNIKDMASLGNPIAANSRIIYTGASDPITIAIAADDIYELYINGTFVGSNNRWDIAKEYRIPTLVGKNVIAVKCTDVEGLAGLVAEINIGNKHFASNERWRVTTENQSGWEQIDFNDETWKMATSYGLHGVAMPWAQYRNVQGISTSSDVKWIWSSDNYNDNIIYLRFTINTSDYYAPEPPSGVEIATP